MHIMKNIGHYSTVRLILGDQLNASHSWYQEKNASTLYVLAELPQELNYARHHGQKVAAFFAAMQEFAQALEKSGHSVSYFTLDDTAGFDVLDDFLLALIEVTEAKNFHYQLPDEYRLREQLQSFCHGISQNLRVNSQAYSSEHFIVDDDNLPQYFKANTAHRMEMFYRKMRVKTNTLMHGDKPLGEKWNYDADNRKKFKKDDLEKIPQPLLFANDVSLIKSRLERHGYAYIGELDNQLLWPVTRKQALVLLDYFCEYLLPLFGTFQDAMTCNSDKQWSLYHSRLSFALNSKMISPMLVVQRAIQAFEHNEAISLSQIEGFVRQIIGWREFVRGIYWANMPSYAEKNYFAAEKKLPNYFWTADTKMSCMQHAIKQSLNFAYAHHIQRLMVTGNFCLIAGIHPDEVDAWYLGIYIDAIEWVEMPNTRGMTQFADGGLLASKPYAASGNYINKMSDYCKSCHYQVKEKDTPNACPFNALYWHFLVKHREVLSKNNRIAMLFNGWDKRSDDERFALLNRAQWCLDNIEML